MIPPTAHFVWLGEEFPWLNVLAIVSAAAAGGFEKVVLHLDGPKSSVFRHKALASLAALDVREIDVARLAVHAGVCAEQACGLFDNMRSPAARSDIVRALVLAAHGGVYLDMDTVTVQSFASLRQSFGAFVGQEQICFAGWNTQPPTLRVRARAYGLAALRYALAVSPKGYRHFSNFAPYYSVWANNAIMGCAPAHPFFRAFVDAMFDLPIELAQRPYAVGPDLLEHVCREYRQVHQPITRLDPSVFYPLPPVISEHWWKRTRNPQLEEVLSPSTVAVHWYASVRTHKLAGRVNRDYVLAHKDQQLFSRLAHRYAHLC